MKTDVKITFNHNGEEYERTYSHIDNTAPVSSLLSFAQGIADLSQDSYVSSNKITTLNIDTENDYVPIITIADNFSNNILLVTFQLVGANLTEIQTAMGGNLGFPTVELAKDEAGNFYALSFDSTRTQINGDTATLTFDAFDLDGNPIPAGKEVTVQLYYVANDFHQAAYVEKVVTGI